MIWMMLACSEQNLVSTAEPPEPGQQPEALGPTTLVEEFVQRTARASDVLFVVDDSGSMAEEQENLSANFHYFADYLFESDVDFHLGVVRAGLGGAADGRLEGIPTFLEPSTDYGMQLFVELVESLGTAGYSTCESGLQGSYLALTDPLASGFNEGFYRDDAILTVIIVSDENDNGVNGDCGWPTARPDAYAEFVQGMKHNPTLVNFGVIAGFSRVDNATPANCDSDLGFADSASQYALARDLLGGVSWSICNPDWSHVLADLGLRAAGLTRQFDLTRVPVLDRLDFDGDGDTSEPALQVFLDRGEGFVDTQPVWASEPDPQNPWDYDATANAIVYRTADMPDEGWTVRAVYPNREEEGQ